MTETPRQPDQPPQTAPTLGIAARALGVSETTLASWLRDGAPGRPSTKGKRDGEFSIEAISEWRRQRDAGRSNGHGNGHGRIAELRGELLSLDLAERSAGLVDAGQAAAAWRRMVAEVKRVSAKLPKQIDRCLPASVPAEIRRLIRKDVLSHVRRAVGVLESFIMGER